MLYLTICITLFVIIAAMHLLAKAKKESLGSLFTWISYGIIVVAILILLCQLARGCMRMRHHEEKGMHGMMMGRHHMMMRGMRGEDMECCDGMGGRMGHDGCNDRMKCGDDMKDGRGMMKGHDDDDDNDSASHEMHKGH